MTPLQVIGNQTKREQAEVHDVETKKKTRRWPWLVGGLLVAAVAIGVAVTPERSLDAGALPPLQTDTQAAAPAPAPEPAGPGTEMSAGMYQVGVDVAAGRYKTPGPGSADVLDMCYFARLSDDSGQFDAIIANGNLQGPGSLTVKAGEFVELTGGCVWSRVG